MRVKYVLSEVLVGLWRNVTMTIAMIITMAVSLTMLGASVLMYMQVDDMKDFYYERDRGLDLPARPDVTDAAAHDARPGDLDGDPLVDELDLREPASRRTRSSRSCAQDAPDLVNVGQAGPAARVVPGEAEGPGAVQDDLPTSTQGTDGHPARSSTRAQLLDKVFNILNSIQKMALVVAIVHGVAALLLVGNTIQVAAYSKRREVAVMKLVGASNWFIQAPFVLEAVVAGLIGSLLGFVALIGAKQSAVRRLVEGAARVCSRRSSGRTSS